MDQHLSFVKAQLALRLERRQLTKVAQDTQVSRRTLSYILEGKRDVLASTVDKLHAYLKANQRKRDL